MAGCAVLISRVGHIVRAGLRPNPAALYAEVARAVMALQADRHYGWPPQHLLVHRAMRIVARLAAFHPHRGMLKGERAALIGVALQTGFFIGKSLVDHAWPDAGAPCRRRGSVRIMTVRTLHKAFVHAVL